MDERVVMDFEDYKSKLTISQRSVLNAVERSPLAEVERVVEQFWFQKKGDDLFNYILLLTALNRSHKSMTRYFTGRCPMKVPQKTGHFFTPLCYAVKMHDLQIFKEFWQRGASIFDKDAEDTSALELAMVGEKDDLIKFVLDELLFSRNRKDLKPDCDDDVALFHAACWTSDSKAIDVFIASNFPLNSRSTFKKDDWKGFTPVHFTVHRSRYYSKESDAVSKILTRDDADLFATDHKGRTPIHLAFKNGTCHLRSRVAVLERISSSNMKQFMNPQDESGMSHFHIICSIKLSDGDDEKHRNCVKYFIDNGVDLNSSISSEDANSPGFTALHLVVQNSCWAILNLLLESGADPNRTDKNGLTPLHLLYSRKEIIPDERWERGLEKIVESFLQHGADAAAKDPEDRTPLHISFRSHRGSRPLDKSEKLLLANNEQGINHTDKDGLSYLHMACTGDDLEIVKKLVVNGAQVNLCVPFEAKGFCGFSALHFAAEWNRVNIVEFLLSHGADVNCVTKMKTSPLHEACYHKFQQMPQTAGENDANDDSIIEWVPSRLSYIQTIELLIKHGAIVNAENKDGRTPLMHSISIPDIFYDSGYGFSKKAPSEIFAKEVFARQTEVLEILLRHGADINIRESYYGTILHRLCGSYEKYPFRNELINIVLDKGANVNAVGKSGEVSPLHVAVEESLKHKGDTSLIELLLERGADVNARSKDIGTPLHVATQSHYATDIRAAVLAKLLDHPCISMNARDHLGQTSLHVAMARREYSIIEKLLESGADINFTDSAGSSPIHTFLTAMEKDIASGSYWSSKKEEDRKILMAVVSHVIGLAKLNMFISAPVRKDYAALLKHVPENDLALLNSKINQELHDLKFRKLDNYTSLYDILFRDGNAMAKLVPNNALRELISSTDLKKRFTHFGCFIKRQYVRGCRRLSVLQPARSALNVISNLDLPDSCSGRILRSLDNGNLRNLIESTSLSGRRRKRPFTESTTDESSAKIPRLDK